MKTTKIIYWTATGLLCALFTFSASMYFFNYPTAKGFFISLGFPIWLIYPLATLKIFGLIAVVTQKHKFLKELAYAGFLFDTILALFAHLAVNDGEFIPAIIGITVVTVSWVYDRKIHGKYTQNLTTSKN